MNLCLKTSSLYITQTNIIKTALITYTTIRNNQYQIDLNFIPFPSAVSLYIPNSPTDYY